MSSSATVMAAKSKYTQKYRGYEIRVAISATTQLAFRATVRQLGQPLPKPGSIEGATQDDVEREAKVWIDSILAEARRTG